MKLVCINNVELGRDPNGKPRHKKLPLTKGKTYESDSVFNHDEVVIIHNDNGEKRIYPSINFVTLDVWREMQLNKLV